MTRMADDDVARLPADDYLDPALLDPHDDGSSAGFLDALDMRDIDGTSFVLLDRLRFRTAAREIIEVTRGFVTDLASTPRFIWRVYPRSGDHNEAAVIHDWLYVKREIARRRITRAEADAVLRDGMRCLKCSPRKVRNFYWSVRLFGWLVWVPRSYAIMTHGMASWILVLRDWWFDLPAELYRDWRDVARDLLMAIGGRHG